MRRNEPNAAKYQSWTTPYARETAETLVAEVVAMDGPKNEEWWMLTVTDLDTEVVLGDLVLQLTHEGHTAEVGYTFSEAHWGKGYAREALEALVAYLFETLKATRVFATLDPDNRASAMLLERVGLLFEGHTRLSYWLDGEVSDDWIYGMTRPDWEAWRNRPRTPPVEVQLREIVSEDLLTVLALRTHKSQENFVAPMSKSFAQALIPPLNDDGHAIVPWFRAIVADEVIVGFVMVALTTEHEPEPFLWRLLIDRMHQRRGIASRALDLVENTLREKGDRSVLVSWGEGRGSPRPFYLARGYEPTGKVEEDEVVARKTL